MFELLPDVTEDEVMEAWECTDQEETGLIPFEILLTDIRAGLTSKSPFHFLFKLGLIGDMEMDIILKISKEMEPDDYERLERHYDKVDRYQQDVMTRKDFEIMITEILKIDLPHYDLKMLMDAYEAEERDCVDYRKFHYNISKQKYSGSIKDEGAGGDSRGHWNHLNPRGSSG
jgi:Ca2+-binding EF-hand superfamily protein